MSATTLKVSVVNLTLDSGERLPFVALDGFMPLILPTRWSLRTRRYFVQSSTLRSNLNSIAHLYEWAFIYLGENLDEYLSHEDLCSYQKLEAYAGWLRARPENGQVASANAYNENLRISIVFLQWALHLCNRGGSNEERNQTLSRKRERYNEYFGQLKVRGKRSTRRQPLTFDEVEAIKTAIGPCKNSQGNILYNQDRTIKFPNNAFAQETALRNWVMFCVALELGLRIGELLKLKTGDIPRRSNEPIRIERNPDDPLDTRKIEPSVKTMERELWVSPQLLQLIGAYLRSKSGGRPRRSKSPYLFLTHTGAPLSIEGAKYIIRSIRKYSHVQHLTWHSLRHTWAERQAERLLTDPEITNAEDTLMRMGGWSSPASVIYYTGNVRTRIAMQKSEEHARDVWGLGDANAETNEVNDVTPSH